MIERYLEECIILKIRTSTSTVVFSLATVGPRVAGITCWFTRAIVTLEFIITAPSYKKNPNKVWLKHNIIYFFNIFSNITGLTNSYHPSCYRHISDRNIYTTSLLLISSVLLSLLRQESLHYISTSYLIGFIVINPTGISTLYLYTSYLISFIVIIPTGISTYYLIGFIVINPTGISTLHLYVLSHRFYCHKSDRNIYTLSLLHISSDLL